MSDLPTDVVIRYGANPGFTFPVETEIVGVQTTPVWDRAGRTVTALTHEWTVKTVLWVDPEDEPDGMGDFFDSVLTQLCRPACNLVLENTAWGDFDINPAGVAAGESERDLIWGPKPQVVAFKHLGYKYAAELTWKVSFCLNACSFQPPTNVMEWNYTLSFGKDRSGYTRRTYAGHVSIAMTRRSPDDGTLVDQADRLREQIRPILPIGFVREDEEFTLSEDKRTLNFRVVDQQLPPNVPPPNVVICDVSHSADSMDKALVRFTHTIRAKYELTTNRARVEAWEHFRALFQDRINFARRNGMTIIPVHLHLGEPEIYGRAAGEFALSYWMFDKSQKGKKNPAPTNIIGKGGLWRTAPESNWAEWNRSLQDAKVNTARGTAGLVFNTSDDAIVDLCLARPPRPPSERSLVPGRIPSVRVSPFSVDAPDPEDSFLDYDLALDVRPIDNTVALQPLPVSPVAYTPAKSTDTSQLGYQIPYRGGPCALVQYRGNPLVMATLSGSAVRAGYGITPPQLLSVGGQKPAPYGDLRFGFQTWVAANYGIPIVVAAWAFRYVLPCLPRQPFLPPPHPLYGSVGNPAAQGGTLSGFVTQG